MSELIFLASLKDVEKSSQKKARVRNIRPETERSNHDQVEVRIKSNGGLNLYL